MFALTCRQTQGVKHLEQIKEAGLETPEVNQVRSRSRPIASRLRSPSLLQIELHPFLQQRDIVEYCQKEGIVVEGALYLSRFEPSLC